ncbi:MAG: hypothetical protein MK212_15775 [Saprospiraceae bacterium]|nr:hypothetical protein [Saprospiraceae bacterium]
MDKNKLLPLHAGGDGIKLKTELPNAAAFDKKVDHIIAQIMSGAPNSGWYQYILERTTRFWDKLGLKY